MKIIVKKLTLRQQSLDGRLALPYKGEVSTALTQQHGNTAMNAYRFCRTTGINRFQPSYLSLIARATVSRHTGTPILEVFNPVYQYWATKRDLRRDEVIRYLGENYTRNMRAA